MESRIFVLFLIAALVLVTLTGCGRNRLVQQDDERPAVIEPEVERRDISIADIDTENFEVGGFIRCKTPHGVIQVPLALSSEERGQRRGDSQNLGD